jgi:hypothetical protein
MAKEVLAIKEDYLEEFIEILKKGIAATEESGVIISEALKYNLESWIDEETEYVKRMRGDDDDKE